MLAALRLVLFDDGNILHSVALSPVVTWALLLGAGWGALRLVVDVGRAFRRPAPPDPPRPWAQPPGD